MNLRTRLLLAQSPLFLALVLFSAVSMLSLTQLGSKSQDILKDNYRSVLAVQRMKDAAERLDDVAPRLLIGNAEGEPARESKPFLDVFERELAVEEANITEPGEREAVRRLRAEWEEAKRILSGLAGAPDREAVGAIHRERLSPALHRVRASLDEILAINQDAMVRKSESAKSFAERLWALTLAGAVAASAVALLTVTVLIRRAVRPLQVLQQAVRRVGDGDLEVRAELRGRDEIAHLARDFNDMAESLHRYRKSSLGDLLRAQQVAQASIDSLPEPIVIFGNQGEVLSVNRAAEELFRGVNGVNDLAPPLKGAVQRLHAHVFGGKGPYVPHGLEEAVRIPSAGGDRFYLPSANPLHDEDGMIIGVTTVFQDVTRFKRFDELKDDMVSTVAHEFRTPLTSMRMAIHLCLEEMAGPLTPKQADLLAAAREECERLQTLVDDLLELSHLQKGIAPTNPEEIAASALVSQALARHRPQAERQSVALSGNTFGGDATVLADPDRIGMVFDNLLLNAFRYTPQGGAVEVRTRREKGRVRFEVSDTGPGIPRAHQEHLFDRFFQVPGAERGAAGLGLSISREIVLAHGGEIGVESEPGLGSTFWFTLNEPEEEEGEGKEGA